METIEVPGFSVERLASGTRREFEKIIPQKTRDRLESTNDFRIVIRDREFKVKSEDQRRILLDSIYWDVAKTIEDIDKGAAVACVDPTYKVKGAFQNEYLFEDIERIEMSYSCGWIYVSGNNVRLTMRDSKEVFDRIVRNLETENPSN